MNNPWLPEKHRILDIIEETDLESTFVVEFQTPPYDMDNSLKSPCQRLAKRLFP